MEIKVIDRETVIIRIKSKGIYHDFIIDSDDFNKVSVFNWSLHKSGYAVANIGYKKTGFKSTILLHRLIMSFPNKLIDHINMDKRDNRKSNLRSCSYSENKCNSYKKSNAISKGISIISSGKFRVRITKNNKTITIGYYSSLDDAKKSYYESRKLYHGEFAFRDGLLYHK
jgi:hypothetical protein